MKRKTKNVVTLTVCLLLTVQKASFTWEGSWFDTGNRTIESKQKCKD